MKRLAMGLIAAAGALFATGASAQLNVTCSLQGEA